MIPLHNVTPAPWWPLFIRADRQCTDDCLQLNWDLDQNGNPQWDDWEHEDCLRPMEPDVDAPLVCECWCRVAHYVPRRLINIELNEWLCPNCLEGNHYQ